MTTASEIKTTAPRGAPVSGWQVLWGALLIVTGILAVMMPAVAALATAIVFAWLLLFSGAFEVAHAIQTRRAAGFVWKLVSGIATFLLGILILVLPLAGVESLALMVAIFMMISGFARSASAFALKPLPGWGWVLFDGLLSIFLGVLIGIGWPVTSIAIIGFLTGFTLISTGVWRIALRNVSVPWS